jgi:hypothetical protein
MKKLLLLLMLFVGIFSYSQKTYYGYGGSSAPASNNQQISLFDSQGDARAYIDFEEDATIFMWDGTPVAFLDKDGDDICVFGFRGGFLGWYENGMIYDKNGYTVGARKEALSMLTNMERMKGMQKMTPMRPMTSMTPMKPFWKNRWSATTLTEFLYFGRK